MTPTRETGHPVRLFLMACGTFAVNVVDRFHEYADARLAEELTLVEQRRRLLAPQGKQLTSGHRGPFSPRAAHVD